MIPTADFETASEKATESQEAYHQLWLEGMTDGSYAIPLQIKHMHNLTYINGYAAGINKWAAELERREQEKYQLAALEF